MKEASSRSWSMSLNTKPPPISNSRGLHCAAWNLPPSYSTCSRNNCFLWLPLTSNCRSLLEAALGARCVVGGTTYCNGRVLQVALCGAGGTMWCRWHYVVQVALCGAGVVGGTTYFNGRELLVALCGAGGTMWCRCGRWHHVFQWSRVAGGTLWCRWHYVAQVALCGAGGTMLRYVIQWLRTAMTMCCRLRYVKQWLRTAMAMCCRWRYVALHSTCIRTFTKASVHISWLFHALCVLLCRWRHIALPSTAHAFAPAPEPIP